MTDIVEVEEHENDFHLPFGLTDKQWAFCREYIIDFNATRATIAAGYSERTASQAGHGMLQKPHIREQIQELLDQRAARQRITPDYTLSTIKGTIEKCQEMVPVRDKKGNQVYMTTPDGEKVAAYTVYDPKSVLRGAELLGKHQKLFTDVTETRHTFTQMPTVEIGRTDKPDAPRIRLSFDIGDEPDQPKSVP